MVRQGIRMLVIGIESDLKTQAHEQVCWRNQIRTITEILHILVALRSEA
jgi:hypothetical protein